MECSLLLASSRKDRKDMNPGGDMMMLQSTDIPLQWPWIKSRYLTLWSSFPLVHWHGVLEPNNEIFAQGCYRYGGRESLCYQWEYWSGDHISWESKLWQGIQLTHLKFLWIIPFLCRWSRPQTIPCNWYYECGIYHQGLKHTSFNLLASGWLSVYCRIVPFSIHLDTMQKSGNLDVIPSTGKRLGCFMCLPSITSVQNLWEVNELMKGVNFI